MFHDSLLPKEFRGCQTPCFPHHQSRPRCLEVWSWHLWWFSIDSRWFQRPFEMCTCKGKLCEIYLVIVILPTLWTSSLISFDTTVVAGWFQHVSFQIALWKIRDTNFRFQLPWNHQCKTASAKQKAWCTKFAPTRFKPWQKQLHIKSPPWLLDLSMPFWKVPSLG